MVKLLAANALSLAGSCWKHKSDNAAQHNVPESANPQLNHL